jgi:hypothetical protein
MQRAYPVVLVGALILLTACGSESDGDDTATTAGGSSATTGGGESTGGAAAAGGESTGGAAAAGTGGTGPVTSSVSCEDYLPAQPTGDVYRVSPSGDDGNDCTNDNPCRTLQHAADVVSEPGSLVLVDNGTYDGFHTEHGGIWFRANGDNVVVNTSHEWSSGPTGDNINVENTDDVVVEGFVVRDADRAGIRIAGCSNVVVMNNRSGPNGVWGIFTGFAPGIRILNNETFESVDEHGIYHSNSDTPNDDFVICGNVSHHNGTNGIQLNGDCYAGGDGMLENGVLAANIVYQNGAKGFSIIAAPGVQIVNNIIYENGQEAGAGGIHLTNEPGCDDSLASHNAVIVNNTVFEPHIAALRITDAASNAIVFNNIFTGRASPVADEVGESDIDGSNIIQNGLDGLNLTSDFRLQAGSIAIDAGLESHAGIDAPNVDIDGNRRPQGSAVDVGAHELPGG